MQDHAASEFVSVISWFFALAGLVLCVVLCCNFARSDLSRHKVVVVYDPSFQPLGAYVLATAGC